MKTAKGVQSVLLREKRNESGGSNVDIARIQNSILIMKKTKAASLRLCVSSLALGDKEKP